MDVSQVNTSSTQKFAFDSLEAVRKRLLDLTARNKLLNFKHSANSVRIIDEQPNELFEALLSEKSMLIASVPEPKRAELVEAGYIKLDPDTKKETVVHHPTAAEWAKHLGLETNFELPPFSESPAHHHTDDKIQTLMFASELEAAMRNVYKKSTTAIEETGANILYLAIGFLEWFESPSSSQGRSAPLITIPVTVEKGKLNDGVFLYSIKYTGEELLGNLCLKELLQQEFQIALPEYSEEIEPEAYFELVQQIINEHQPSWKLKRQASIVLLDFTKLLMYLDLDPSRWPKDKNILQHKLIKRFFESNQESAANIQPVIYDIDEHPDVHTETPLVLDADSTQHAALLDAISGKSMVIVGPPGTGKSQTITNLIAAALGKKKKVLFVAEKMAALEVVKSRLEKVGLGEFCLELHSHKTQKKSLLEDIQKRLTMNPPKHNSQMFEAQIDQYESLRERLTTYANLVNNQWRNTGYTIHQILNRSARLNSVETLMATSGTIDFKSFGDISHASIARYEDDLHHYVLVLEQVKQQVNNGAIENHPWFGIQNHQLTIIDEEQCIEALKQLRDCTRHAESSLLAVGSQLGAKLNQNIQTARGIAEASAQLPTATFNVSFELLPAMSSSELDRRELKQTLDDLSSVYLLHEKLVHVFAIEVLTDKTLALEICEHAAQLQTLTNLNVTLSQLVQKIKHIDELIQDLAKVSATKQELLTSLKGYASPSCSQLLDQLMGDSVEGLQHWCELFDVVSELDPRFISKRDSIFDDDRLDYSLNEFCEKLHGFRHEFERLSSRLHIDDLPTGAALQELIADLSNKSIFRWFGADWWDARRQAISLSKGEGKPFATIANNLRSYLEVKQKFERFEKSSEIITLLGQHYRGIETDIHAIQELRRWFSLVRAKFGQGFGKMAQIGDFIIELPASVFKAVQAQKEQGLLESVRSVQSKLNELAKTLNTAECLVNSQQPLIGEGGSLPTVRQTLEVSLSSIQRTLIVTDIESSLLNVACSKLTSLANARSNVINSPWKPILDSSTHHVSLLPDEQSKAALSCWLGTYEFMSQLAYCPSEIIDTITTTPTAQKWHNICQDVETLCQSLRDYDVKAEQFSQIGKLDIAQWLKSTTGTFTDSLERHQLALNSPKWLSTWVDYLKIKTRLGARGSLKLLNLIEDSVIPEQLAKDLFHKDLFRELSAAILRENPVMRDFTGLDQTAIRAKFQEIDRQLQVIQQDRLRSTVAKHNAPAGVSGGRVSEYTELSLLRREVEKKTRHIPIRQLVNRAGKALQELKPCFMMSPMSVAQYIQAGQLTFDLVIMDEASQIKPEDALGTVARGQQVIIVGDPKQLPPTSFFEKITEEEENSDVSILQDSESILEASKNLLTTRILQWHYRSRHESLIAFSNIAFYGSDLVVFPSPFADSPDYGVKFTHVQGKFVNRRNLAEAEAIAMAAKAHMLQCPSDTLGIVAMNSEQSEHIERAIETLAKDDPQFRSVLEANAKTSEPMFVKNLENVQGDERDVIMISFTYGPMEKGGAVPQRFGPINTAGGWRRLNVLFSRAKKRMHVFSSMRSSDVLVSETSNLSIKALRDFLAFAETGVLHQPKVDEVANYDSDFEKSVAERLAIHGFECATQVGVAGYFIDLCVRDPRDRGTFLLAVECDGASYHSGKTARDRDRLRQQVLESLGWKVARIWSTDWFKNADAEVAKLLNQLKAIMAATPVIERKPEINFDLSSISSHQTPEKLNNTTVEVVDVSVQLSELLWNYQNDILAPFNKHVEPERRLLSNEMIKALELHRPTTLSEFQQRIPSYLRSAVAPSEGVYLKNVLKLIEDFVDDEEVGQSSLEF